MSPIKAFIFDVFGTTVDWRSSVVAELEALGKERGQSADWVRLAQEWRNGYMKNVRLMAEGTLPGPLDVDAILRGILDDLLRTPEYAHLGSAWDEKTRQHLNLVWHRLNGWPDTVDNLHALKKQAIIATLPNSSVRLLIDLAKHAGLPWDVIFSAELFDTIKPNPKAYLEAMRHLALPPENCAMVAAHIYDLRAAGRLGMRTVYIRRPEEDEVRPEEVRAKAEGARWIMCWIRLRGLRSLLVD
ncbi:haloacid dehalogenase [Pholiota molesta]|nr:haloacid dehalogenase [Pholiota molesta]